MLKLLYGDEFTKENMTSEELQSLEQQGVQLVWVVTTPEEWAIGKQLGVAMLPYDPEFSDGEWRFPEAEIIVTSLEDLSVRFLELVYCRAKGLPVTIYADERFVLREFTMQDMDSLFALYEDDSLYPFVEPLFERTKEEAYEAQYIQNMYHLLGFGMWLVCEPENGTVIGRAGLEVREHGEPMLEMGYLIHRDYRGQGLASAVCGAIIDYAKEELDYPTLHCFIHEDNRASVRFAEKLGFSLVSPQKDENQMLHFVLDLQR